MKSVWRATFSVTCLIVVGALMQSCGGSKQTTPLLTITTAALPNGKVETEYSEQVQASGGVAPYNWGISAGTLPHNLQLNPSATNTTTISGTPDTPIQADAFSVKVTDSANQSATQPYTVSVLALPDSLSFVPTGLDFLPQLTGIASITQAATLTNTGSSAVAINNIASSGTNATDFTQANNCGSNLVPETNCVITVTFIPSQAGPRVASVTITDDTTGSPHQLLLAGIGLISRANATLSATMLTFGGQEVGTTSAAQTLTLTNYGEATLNISGIAATGDFAETSGCGASLARATSCPISVSFTPTALGSRTGTLSVIDNVTGSPQTVSLSGTGTTSQGTLSGACFGTTSVGLCTFVGDPASCPVGTAATNPHVVSFNCFGNGTEQRRVDTSRRCQGQSRYGQINGLCMVK
jgi:hypothetical protein